MARKPKAADINNRSKLIAALSFVSAADTGKDVDKYSFVKIKDGMLSAANDTFTIGCQTDAEIELCLHGSKLKAALEHCGATFQLTQVDGNSVSIKSDKFKAVVPCIDMDLLPIYKPDPCVAKLCDLRDCFALLQPLLTERSDRVIENAIHLRPNTAVATNGGLLFEYWHGYDLPPGLLIPKLTAAVIAKLKKPIDRFGFSDNSATFWFDDNSYIRTKLVIGPYPDTDRLFATDGLPQPMPTEFFTALDAIEKFVENDSIYFTKGHVAAHPSLQIGANYLVEGLPDGHCYSLQYWKRCRELIGSVAWPSDLTKPTQIYGANMRGLIMGKAG